MVSGFGLDLIRRRCGEWVWLGFNESRCDHDSLCLELLNEWVWLGYVECMWIWPFH